MKMLIRHSAAHPVAVLGLLLLISFLAWQPLGSLRIAVSAESMLERGTPAWDYYVATEQTFGTEDVIIVVLRDPDIFDQAKLFNQLICDYLN